MTNPALMDIPSDVVGDCWTEFSNFWTESIPTFFTETIPQAFQAAWDATAEWIDQCVKPFFDDCAVWFEENAAWLWPAAIAFVAGLSFVVGIALLCLCCQNKEEGAGDGDPITNPERKIIPLNEHKAAQAAQAAAKLGTGATTEEVTKALPKLTDLNRVIADATDKINEVYTCFHQDTITSPQAKTTVAAKVTLESLSETVLRLIEELRSKHTKEEEKLTSLQTAIRERQETLSGPESKVVLSRSNHRHAADAQKLVEDNYARAKSDNQHMVQTRDGITAQGAVEAFLVKEEAIKKTLVDRSNVSFEQKIQNLRSTITDDNGEVINERIRELQETLVRSNRAEKEAAIAGLRKTIVESNRDEVQARIQELNTTQPDGYEGQILLLRATITDGNRDEVETRITQLENEIVDGNEEATARQIRELQSQRTYDNSPLINIEIQRLERAIQNAKEEIRQLRDTPMGQLITTFQRLGENVDNTKALEAIKKQAVKEYEDSMVAQFNRNIELIEKGDAAESVEGSRLWHTAQVARLEAIATKDRETFELATKAHAEFSALNESNMRPIRENLGRIKAFVREMEEQHGFIEHALGKSSTAV